MPPWQASRAIPSPSPRCWSVVSGTVYGLVSVSIWPIATKPLHTTGNCHLQLIYVRVIEKASREQEINYIIPIFMKNTTIPKVKESLYLDNQLHGKNKQTKNKKGRKEGTR